MQSMRITVSSFFVQVQIRLDDITCSIPIHISVIDRQPYFIVRHMGIRKKRIRFSFSERTNKNLY